MDHQAERKALVLIPADGVRDRIGIALRQAGLAVSAATDATDAMRQLQYGDMDVLLTEVASIPPGVLSVVMETAELKPWLRIVFVVNDTEEHRILAASPSVTLPNVSLLGLPSGTDAEPLLTERVRETCAQPQGPFCTMLRGRHREMSILTSTVESALNSGNIGEAMRGLANGLSILFQAPMLAILEVEEDAPRFSVACREQISEEEIRRMQEELRERYWLIGGGDLPAGGECTVSRLPGSARGNQPLRFLVVHFFTDSALRGCFGIGIPEGQDLTAEQLLFLEYVPTHLSTVFSGLGRVRYLAMHDALTGAYNRMYLEEHLKNRLAGHQRYGRDLSVVMLDLDNFKEINDSFGHPVGDLLLKEFAALVRRVCRSADMIARYGGDEFVVVLESTNADGARRFAIRLMEDARRQAFAADLENVDVRVSAGMATIAKGASADPMTADRLLGQADAALYAAKAAGRNCGASWPSMEICRPSAIGSAESSPRDAGAPGQGPRQPPQDSAPGRSPRMIVVDDQPEVLSVVTRLLHRAGYAADRATGGAECLARIKEIPDHYDLLITDLNMPDMDGLQLLERVRHLSPRTAGIVLTGYATIDNAVSSFRSGVRAFLRKPVDGTELLGAIQTALEVQALENENQRYREELERMVVARSSQLRQALAETRQAFEFAVEGFATLVDMRERSCGRHVLRVQAMSLVLGKKLGLSARHLERLARGAVLHDIGKVAVPDPILLKPGPLDAAERVVMQTHVQIGYDILRKAPWLEDVSETVYCHHEMFDGSGYPRGLKGEEICQEARIFTVVDAYDAMRADRVYHTAVDREEAVREIMANSGVLYDPRVVAAFEKSIPELEDVLARYKDSPEVPG